MYKINLPKDTPPSLRNAELHITVIMRFSITENLDRQ